MDVWVQLISDLIQIFPSNNAIFRLMSNSNELSPLLIDNLTVHGTASTPIISSDTLVLHCMCCQTITLQVFLDQTLLRITCLLLLQLFSAKRKL